MSWIKNVSREIIKQKKLSNNYRIFKKLTNIESPYSIYNDKKIINWSNNDYNSLTHNLDLKNHLNESIQKYGSGSSGTRNIGGSNKIHNYLECKIAKLHNKEHGLLFNSGYLANLSSIQALGRMFKNGMILSDQLNHSSIINGIKLSQLPKKIFIHNDCEHLESLLKKNHQKDKIIIVESLYSTNGNIAPLDDIIYLKKKYNALLYIDEIHAVGVHGKKLGGISDLSNNSHEIDIIMGGFGKGFGLVGGYITGDTDLIDAIRLLGDGFIFTTSLPPHLVSGIIKSIDISIKNSYKHQFQRKYNVNLFKNLALQNEIPLVHNNFVDSQIQSVLIGCSQKAEKIHHILLNEHRHYVQHLNYPTVSKGNETLRISLKCEHNEEMMSDLFNKLNYLL